MDTPIPKEDTAGDCRHCGREASILKGYAGTYRVACNDPGCQKGPWVIGAAKAAKAWQAPPNWSIEAACDLLEEIQRVAESHAKDAPDPLEAEQAFSKIYYSAEAALGNLQK